MLIDDIRNGENDRLEFKESPNRDSSKWLKTVVAFANGRGGRLVFGVGNDRMIKGVGGDLFALKDSIVDAIADACVPTVPVEVYMTSVEGRTLIVAEVGEGKDSPYYIKAQGDPAGVYVRYDATTRVADELSLKDLRVRGSGKGYDSFPCRGLEVDEKEVELLCDKMFKVACANAKSDAERSLIKKIGKVQLVKWGVLIPRGRGVVGSNAYAMLVGSDSFPTAVKCGLFKGKTRSVFVDRRKFVGPLYEQIESAYQYVLSKLNLGARFGKVHREDVYEIPPSAVRELVVNAFAHRDYVTADASDISVAIYDDRLEISSPGRLPFGVTVEKMREGVSVCRNQVLVKALEYMNYIEDWGSGIPRILDDVRAAGLGEIKFEAWPTSFRAIIYRQLAVNDGGKSGRDLLCEQILALMRDNPDITIAAIITATGGAKRTLEREIADMTARKMIRRVGGAHGGHWEVLISHE